MKKLIIASFAFIFLLNACDDGFGLFDGSKRIVGTGVLEKQERAIKDFKGVELLAAAHVFIKQGTGYKVTVEGQKNILDVLETVVENDILVIKLKSGSWSLSFDKLNVYVETPSVSRVGIAGSGDIAVESGLNADILSLDISGSGNIKIPTGIMAKKLETSIGGSGNIEIGTSTIDELIVSVSGSGDFSIKGSGNVSKFSLTGSGDVDAEGFVAKVADANTIGSGNINCHATESLDASITGSGDIIYKGNPPVLKTNVTGSGEIKTN